MCQTLQLRSFASGQANPRGGPQLLLRLKEKKKKKMQLILAHARVSWIHTPVGFMAAFPVT